MELGDLPLTVWTGAHLSHTGTQSTETATQFQIDPALLFLLTTIRKRGWLFAHFHHWPSVTEPKKNVSQVVFQDNLPTLHPDSVKLHAPTYLTLLTRPLVNAFWSAPLASLLTLSTTNAKISALEGDLLTRQLINALALALRLITVTITELELWHVSWNVPITFMLRVDFVSVAAQYFLQIRPPTCALHHVWTRLPIPQLTSASQTVSVLEKSPTTVPILVLLSALLIQICMKKTPSVWPNAPLDSLLIQLQDWEAAGLDAQKASGHNLNLNDAFRPASLDTLAEILPTLATEHAYQASLLI